MLITPGRRKRVVVLLQLKHMSDQELPTTIIDVGVLRRFHHGSFGSWPAIPSANRFIHAFDLCSQKWVGVEILVRKIPGAIYLLLNLQSINNECELAKNLVSFLVEL